MYCPAFLVFLAGRLPCLGGKGWSLFGCGSLICLVLVVMDGCFLMGCCFFLVLVTFQVLVFLVLFSLFPYFGFLSVSPSCLSFLMASNLYIHIVILGFICPVSSCFVFRFLDCSFILLFFLHFWFILCLTICCIFLCFIFLLLLPIWLIRLNSGKSLPLPCSVLSRLDPALTGSPDSPVAMMSDAIQDKKRSEAHISRHADKERRSPLTR